MVTPAADASTDIAELAALLPSRGRIIVVSGPSGVGKDAVLDALLARGDGDLGLARCVTATTRPRAAGEVHGRDYTFMTPAEFEAGIASGAFLEHARYSGHLYGTPRAAVEPLLAAGTYVLLKIEVDGARQVRQADASAVLVFVAPPSWAELERRLRARGRDGADDIARRLDIARTEIGAARHYDYVVVNDDVARAAAVVRAILIAERARAARPAEVEE